MLLNIVAAIGSVINENVVVSATPSATRSALCPSFAATPTDATAQGKHDENTSVSFAPLEIGSQCTARKVISGTKIRFIVEAMIRSLFFSIDITLLPASCIPTMNIERGIVASPIKSKKSITGAGRCMPPKSMTAPKKRCNYAWIERRLYGLL